MSEGFPAQGRLGGIDFGTVRIGIALTDPDRILSSPCETYQRRTPQLDETFFKALAGEERLTGWVVGLPLHMSGDESQKSLEARASVKEFYRLNHRYQTVDFVRGKHAEYLGLSRGKKSLWEALEYLNTLVDESDPDTDLSQIAHLLQTGIFR